LLRSIEGIYDIEGVNNLAINRHKVTNGSYESLDGGFGHVLKSVLHNELGLLEEFLKLSHFVTFFAVFIERVPGFAKLLRV
jgi:hypothetical protein